MWDLIVSVPDHCLSFYFSWVSNFFCFISFGNKWLNFNFITLHLWKKITWGLTYFDQFILLKSSFVKIAKMSRPMWKRYLSHRRTANAQASPHMRARTCMLFSQNPCCSLTQYERQHDKTNKMTVRPAKTQISLGIHPVWSESSLCA